MSNFDKFKSRNFMERLLVSLLVAVVIFLTIYFSVYDYFKPVFVLMTAGVIGGALWEFYRIAQNKGGEPLTSLGIIGSIAYLCSLQLALDRPAFALLPSFILFLLLTAGFLSYFFSGERPLSNLAITFFGLVYLTIPLGFMISLNLEFGRAALVYLILITKLTDTGAYFFGKQYGKVKLAPYISPNKSWEGAIGGFSIGVLSSFLLAPFVGFSLVTGIFLGIILSLASIFGDLTESLLKRDQGVKDSNHLPGLGGFLDVVDSLVFTAPLMYFYLKLGSTVL